MPHAPKNQLDTLSSDQAGRQSAGQPVTGPITIAAAGTYNTGIAATAGIYEFFAYETADKDDYAYGRILLAPNASGALVGVVLDSAVGTGAILAVESDGAPAAGSIDLFRDATSGFLEITAGASVAALTAYLWKVVQFDTLTY